MLWTKWSASRWLRLGPVFAAAFLALAPSTGAATTPLIPSSNQFNQLVAIGSLLCTEAPAQDCVEHGWRFTDANRNGSLDVEELTAVRAGFLEWAAEVQESLSGRDRLILNLGRNLLRIVPLTPLFALYDENEDGELSQEELLVDIQMDQRPMSVILADRNATDWNVIRGRLGRGAALLQMLGLPQ